MKCPKCGYNSFEYHNSCKKCSADLSAYKQTFNIIPIVLPPEVRESKAEELRAADSSSDTPAASVETHDDMFAFDLPDDASPASEPAVFNDDPFNFDDDPPTAAPQSTADLDDGFSNLLESTSQAGDDPFASYTATPAEPQANTESNASGPGEFDLENFSWDDTPADTATSATDDLDSLFGDTSDSTKK